IGTVSRKHTGPAAVAAAAGSWHSRLCRSAQRADPRDLNQEVARRVEAEAAQILGLQAPERGSAARRRDAATTVEGLLRRGASDSAWRGFRTSVLQTHR